MKTMPTSIDTELSRKRLATLCASSEGDNGGIQRANKAKPISQSRKKTPALQTPSICNFGFTRRNLFLPSNRACDVSLVEKSKCKKVIQQSYDFAEIRHGLHLVQLPAQLAVIRLSIDTNWLGTSLTHLSSRCGDLFWRRHCVAVVYRGACYAEQCSNSIPIHSHLVSIPTALERDLKRGDS